MIGDKMLLYDRDNEMFFAGYKPKSLVPKWSKAAKGAMVVNRMGDAYRYKEQLGIGVRIVSETEARKIDALREYREAENARAKV